jgi:hypothetical protein
MAIVDGQALMTMNAEGPSPALRGGSTAAEPASTKSDNFFVDENGKEFKGLEETQGDSNEVRMPSAFVCLFSLASPSLFSFSFTLCAAATALPPCNPNPPCCRPFERTRTLYRVLSHQRRLILP